MYSEGGREAGGKGGRRRADLKGEAVLLVLAPEVGERAHVNAGGVEGRGVVVCAVQPHHRRHTHVAQQPRVELRAEAPLAVRGVKPLAVGREGAVGGGEDEDLAGDDGGDIAVDGAAARGRRD